MEIPILIEKISDGRFRAGPIELIAEGVTPDESLQKLRAMIDEKIAAGAKIEQIEIPGGEHPWRRFAGTLDPNDPIVQEWEEIMKENRRKDDENPDYM
jgi:hypothetical protein